MQVCLLIGLCDLCLKMKYVQYLLENKVCMIKTDSDKEWQFAK